jgi:hypothetical protein
MTATGKMAFFAALLCAAAVLTGCEVPPKSAMTVTAYSDDKI